MLQNYILIVSSLLLLISVSSKTILLDPCERNPCVTGEICISKGNMDFVCVGDVSRLSSAIGSRKTISMQNQRFQISRQDSLVAPDDKPSDDDEYILKMMVQPQTQTVMAVEAPQMEVKQQFNPQNQMINTVVPSSNDQEILNNIQGFGKIQNIPDSLATARMAILQNSNDKQTMVDSFLNDKPKVEIPTKPVTPPEISDENDDDHILNMILGFNSRSLAVRKVIKSCNDGYFGLYCENKYDTCRATVNPCNYLTQQGYCVNDQSNTGYHCSCDPLYTGKECELKLNKTCLVNDCNKYDNKAKCFNTDNDIYCECSTGYSGRFCEKINYCENINCQNGGTCINLIDSFYCKCGTDYKGKFCQISKTCERCSNNTIYCDKSNNNCVCLNGYTGRFCEAKINYCESNSCIHGQCVETSNDFKCFCDAGYSGKNCNESVTICSTNPCHNQGRCFLSDYSKSIDTPKAENSSFYCTCEIGYTGQLCEILIDYCESSPCKNGAKCHSELNGYSCECMQDYLGLTCDIKIDNCNHSKCASGSTCISMIGDFKCLCEEGKDGRYCNNIVNYCLNNDCMNGQCYSVQHDELYCSCSPGYIGNLCEEELDECKSDPCVNGGTCYDLVDRYYCRCPPEYTGKNCEHKVNFCSLDQCNANNTVHCVNYNGGLKCVCKNGFNGRFCEVTIGQCESLNPCHSGTCVIDKESYKCVDCLPGYEGKDCNKFIDFCSEKACQYNETCYSKLNSHYCSCSGNNCVNHNDKCELNKCKNNATCQINSNNSDGYICLCQEGYEGNYCELKIDACANITCDYGYCYNGKCICDPKLPYCKKSDCEKIDCLNGGKCIDIFLLNNTTKSICYCPSGMTGAFCETSIYCTKELCGSNSCKTVHESFECKCNQTQNVGTFCNKNLDDQLKSYENLLRSERQQRTLVECRFGYSKLSKIFITIVSVCILCFLIIAVLIGHCIVLSFKKTHKIEVRAKSSITENFNKNFSRANNNTYSNVASSNEFIIPRPQIRDKKVQL